MNLCQWLARHRVDHLFYFWRRLTRHEAQALRAAEHLHCNLRRQNIIVPSVELPSGDQVRHNEVPFLRLGTCGMSLSTAISSPISLIRCKPRWTDMEPSSVVADETSEPSTCAPMMQPEVHMMLRGHGYHPKPVPNWRKCALIQASRKAEFRPLDANMAPEIRPLPDSVRASLPGCKLFRPRQIAHYNQVLKGDGRLVSGVEKVAARVRTKPGRLYHKFDSLCALAMSKAGRLLLVQDSHLSHVFYAICYDPTHMLYIELLNMYERRWFALSASYGKQKAGDV